MCVSTAITEADGGRKKIMFLSNSDKAKLLTEALPYIQKYHNKTIVVKYGGNAMINDGLKDAVITDLVLLSCVGINVVLVHGGGPEIEAMTKRVGIETKFINGLRYTDEDTIDIVQMVLAGKTNKDLVNRIQRIGGNAIGLSGIDGGLIKASKYEDGVNDYGYVGDIVEIDTTIIKSVLEKGFIPVISTVAAGVDENPVYNINADTAAAKIAVALKAANFILLTDVRGVLRDPKDEDTLIPLIKSDEVAELKKSGVISKGMIPKVDCCVDTIQGGVEHTCIIDGRILHSILLEILSDEGIGTMFIN
jgi:acetylglutamate kinase